MLECKVSEWQRRTIHRNEEVSAGGFGSELNCVDSIEDRGCMDDCGTGVCTNIG